MDTEPQTQTQTHTQAQAQTHSHAQAPDREMPAPPATAAGAAEPPAAVGPVTPPRPRHARWFRVVPPHVLLALTLTIVVSFVVLGVSELTASRVAAVRKEAERVSEAIRHIGVIRSTLARAESAQRGFLLMGEPRYLEPFHAATQQAQKSLVQLAALTHGDARAAGEARHLVAVATSKIDEMRLTVSNAEQGRHEQAMNLMRAGYGIQLMEELEQHALALQAQELAAMGGLEQAIQRALLRQRAGLGFVVFLNLVFLAVLANLLVRQFQLREQHRAELQEQAALLERQVAARTEELSSLSSHLQASSERDKSRLARDLHDELGGILTSAKIDLAWMEGHCRSADPDVVPRLQRLSATLDEAVNVKRRVVEDLRPSLLDHLGLGPALDWYVHDACSKAGLRCSFRSLPDGEQVPPEVAIAIYRTVQEGLTNTMRHAQATEVEISLERQRNGYKLHMADNGIGIADFRPDKLSHGIAGMRQRARALGGRFALRTGPGEGTTIEAYFPLPRDVAG